MVANAQSITVGLHWLSVTFHTIPKAVVALVMDYLVGNYKFNPEDWEQDFIDTGRSGRRYQSILEGPYGISLYTSPWGGGHCHLEIKGEAIDRIGQLRLFEFLEALPGFKVPAQSGELKLVAFKVTRIDIAIDHAPLSPRDCYEAFQNGDIRCAANRKTHKWFSNSEGDSFYLGSRLSGRMLRIYNRRGFTRVELECKGDWARAVGSRTALNGCGDFEAFSLGFLRQFVDFVDGKTGGSITRAPLLPWWAAFVRDAEKASLKPDTPRIVSASVEAAYAWLKRILPTLAVYRKALLLEVDQMCEWEETQFKPKHLQKLREMQRGQG